MKQQIKNYKVEKVTELDSVIAYKFYGKRGKVINLIKNQNKKNLYFMINAKTWESENIEGCNWVEETNGILKLVKLL